MAKSRMAIRFDILSRFYASTGAQSIRLMRLVGLD